MKKIIALIILVFGFCGTCFAQSYCRFYSDNYITAKINAQGYKGNCGVYPEHLYIRLKGNTPVIVSGYIKIRFTECASGRERFKEEYFSVKITNGEIKINDYFNPNHKVGNYETIEFYIDKVTPTIALNVYDRGYYIVTADFAYVYYLDAYGQWLPPTEGYPKGTRIYIHGTLTSNPQLAIVSSGKNVDTYIRMCDIAIE